MSVEMLSEDSEDSDWVKQAVLTIAVSAVPYCGLVSSTHSRIEHSELVRQDQVLSRQNSQKLVGVQTEPRLLRTTFSAMIHGMPGIKSSLRPPKVSKSKVLLYSHGGTSFAWSSGQAVTFQSLPQVWACITMHESSDKVVRRNPMSSAKGAFQIESLMWTNYKPSNYPANPNAATLSQQYRVALRIFRADGFAEWQTHSLCGV